MSDKLDRFTRRARHVLVLAQEETVRLNHSAIDTEHLLLALVREENSVAVKVLRALGVEPGQVIRMVERAVGRGEVPSPRKPMLALHTKRVIELAVDEACLMGHHYIGTEHLLLGLVRLEEGAVVKVLQVLGIDLARVRTQIARHILQQRAEAKPPAQGMRLYDDLTAAAEAGKLDPLIGRQAEIERMIQTLSRRTKHNLLLIGEPGVGKRALVCGVAQRLSTHQVPPSLLNHRLLVLDASHLATSVVYRDLAEDRLAQVFDKSSVAGTILFIDRIHRLVGAAGTSIDMANLLKLKVGRGEVKVIGTTTPSQYTKYMDNEVEREWSFQSLRVEEASPDATVAILHSVKNHYEHHHQLLITDAALEAAAHLAARYIPDRFLPDKAIDLIDETASHVRMHHLPATDAVRKVTLQLQQVRQQKCDALEAQRFDEALDLRHREVELEAQLADLYASGHEVEGQLKVTLEDIAAVVSQWADVPVSRLVDEEQARGQGDR